MAKANNLVTFLTDFGSKDGFVGTMKGVLMSINPNVRFVDISVHITPQKIWEGAFVLRNCYKYFPPGTTHLVVIDPGVGSSREGVIVETKKYFFVAPDNGVLTLAFRMAEVIRTVEIQNEKYFMPEVSSTFHGRDIFSSVAAHLSMGVPVTEFGPEVEQGPSLSFPGIETIGDMLYGKLIHIDNFGNLVTNISPKVLNERGLNLDEILIGMGSRQIMKVHKTYSDVEPGKLLALINSSGFLEIAVNQGNAAKRLRARTEDDVCIRKRD
ncbi:MAG: hypothetical protein B6244_11740 [Candidatus Cloacimonetes bacterium 4572_55]|nr:MAG: hypothetical protein B6244_11740 [Candidatus Cloacimonetes bacterium 4572_55]